MGIFDPAQIHALANEARAWMLDTLAMPLREFERCEILLVDRRAFGPPARPAPNRLGGPAVASARAGDFRCSTLTSGTTMVHLRDLRVRVVSGHPTAATRLILAHELAHLWQAEQHLRQDLTIREGHAVWVEHQLATSRGETALAQALENSTDPIYGDGFRAVRAMLQGGRAMDAARVMVQRFS